MYLIQVRIILIGTDVRARELPSTSSNILATLEKNTVVTLIEWNIATANGYEWAKIKLANGTIGYIANKYLLACNDVNNVDNKNDNNESHNEVTLPEMKNISDIAKVNDNYLIVLPGKNAAEVANALNITKFEVFKEDKSKIGNSDNLHTNYNYKVNELELVVVVMGDVYSDGEITSKDYMKIKNQIMGTSTLTESEKIAADVYKDNTITSKDYMKIKNHIMGTALISLD